VCGVAQPGDELGRAAGPITRFTVPDDDGARAIIDPTGNRDDPIVRPRVDVVVQSVHDLDVRLPEQRVEPLRPVGARQRHRSHDELFGSTRQDEPEPGCACQSRLRRDDVGAPGAAGHQRRAGADVPPFQRGPHLTCHPRHLLGRKPRPRAVGSVNHMAADDPPGRDDAHPRLQGHDPNLPAARKSPTGTERPFDMPDHVASVVMPFNRKQTGHTGRSVPPYNAKLCLNGNEWAKRLATKAGIGFTALDNGFATVEDVAAVQAICNELGPGEIDALLRKWLAIPVRPGAGGVGLPGRRADQGRQRVDADRAGMGGHPAVGGDRQHVAQAVRAHVFTQVRVSTIDFVAGDPTGGNVRLDGAGDQRPGHGRIENSQVAVYLTYAAPRGHALIDRALYLPKSWTEDSDRCNQAAIPQQDRVFATKPRLAVPLYWRCTPTDWVPFLTSPVSSTTRIAPGSPKASMT
jgi:hypothetical protein